MKIGPYLLPNNVVLAPMAGVTDLPYRLLCRELGAGMTVAEMVGSAAELQGTEKTRLRMSHDGEPTPRVAQIVGADPAQMAEAARRNVAAGAEIVDINMGCPAKKVCNVAAGSALMRDETLVSRILASVIKAVPVPVTLKIRTGWDPSCRNGPRIAAIAEQAGIQCLTVHGRTRDCGFRGTAEYDTAAIIKNAVSIPVLVNGDIDSPARARAVLDQTGADGVMIGRAAQGRPWIFREIATFLSTGRRLPPPGAAEIGAILLRHLRRLHDFYGPMPGVRVARKHIGWYLRACPGGEGVWESVNRTESCTEQIDILARYFARQPVSGCMA